MPKIVPIVEGEGEVTALPPLLTNALHRMGVYDISVSLPKNAKGRDNLIKPSGLETFLERALIDKDCGAVLVLLDAEDGCALQIARGFAARIAARNPPCVVAVVGAAPMFENWIVASLETVRGQPLGGRPGIAANNLIPPDAEAVKGKAFLNHAFPRNSGRAYKETLDQEAMARLIDHDLAHTNSRSFRRFVNAVAQMTDAIRGGTVVVTPEPMLRAAP